MSMTVRIAALGRLARRAVAAHSRRHEDGITLAIFALALVVLLGMVAVGIDGSRIYDERRRAQNAADHAAIAAAYESCVTTAANVALAAEAAGLNSALQNGFDDNPSDEVDVNVTGGTGSHQYEAIIETTIPTTFGAILGFTELDTTARAEAEATGCDESGTSGAAIHAGGTNCPGGSSLNNVEISGNDHTVNGLTYTNGSFKNGGSSSDFLNPPNASVQYVTTFSGGSNTYSAAQSKIPLPPAADQWPDGFAPADLSAAAYTAYRNAAIAAGRPTNQKEINITTNGVYYTDNNTGDIEIKSITNGAKFVVVSRHRPIKIGVELNGTYHAWDNPPAGTPAGVILVAGHTPSDGKKCDNFAFERSGKGGTFRGIFWTPNGMSRWSGNEGTIHGGFVTWAFQMNGNDHVINGGAGGAAAEPFVFLLQ
jgi:Putative Flp pilus-assembly TadE/G-like